MSRIDDLIAHHCPSGVPFRSLGDVAQYVRGVTFAKSAQMADGAIPVLRANNISLSSNTLNFKDVIRVSGSVRVREDQHLFANDIVISAASGSRAHVGKVAFLQEDLPDHVFGGFMGVLRSVEAVHPRFLFHVLTGESFAAYLNQALSTSTINNLNSTIVRGFKIPVPPRQVQEEVVAILDEFRRLESELESQLESELELRSRQYAFYRDSLVAPAEGAEWRLMSEVGDFIRGRRFTKDDVVAQGIPSIHYGEIYTRYGVFAAEALSHVRSELEPSLRFARTGDVVIAGVGETVEDVGKAVAWLGKEEVAIHDDCFAFRHTLDPKFVAYYFQTEVFHSELAKHVSRAKVKRISATSLGMLKIPVPPREEQERVVAVLDKFDALVNDLSAGLPAEIRARQAQYEYYRDRLLTFEELAA